VTIKNKFHLPIIGEILDEIASAQYFSMIDLASGFIKSDWFLRMKQKLPLKLIMDISSFELCDLASPMRLQPSNVL